MSSGMRLTERGTGLREMFGLQRGFVLLIDDRPVIRFYFRFFYLICEFLSNG